MKSSILRRALILLALGLCAVFVVPFAHHMGNEAAHVIQGGAVRRRGGGSALTPYFQKSARHQER